MSTGNDCESDESDDETLGINKDTIMLLQSIHHYVKLGSVEELSILFDENHYTLKKVIRDFNPSLLHEACKCGHIGVVHLLLSYFENELDINEEKEEGTPLAVACRSGKYDIVQMLTKTGANLGDMNNQENSPLCIATQHGYSDIVHYLIEHYKEQEKKDILEPVDVHRTLIYLACRGGYVDLVKFFMKSLKVDLNVSISEHDPELTKPISAAVCGKHYKIVEYLLDNGAFFNESFIESYGEVVYNFLSNFIQPIDENNDQNMIARWSNKGLGSIPNQWVSSHKPTIIEVDLSYNHLESIDNMFYKSGLSSPDVNVLHLRRLNLSHNKIKSLPVQIFQIPVLEILNLSHNLIVNLTEESQSAPRKGKWNCPSLRYLYLTGNKLTSLTLAIQQIQNLEHLFLDSNHLTSFVEPWKCPLEYLNLSKNQLEQLPEDVSIQWSHTLKYLDLSSNLFTEISLTVCKLEKVISINLSNNQIATLPAPSEWKCKHLEILNLSNNKLCNQDSDRSASKPTTLFERFLNHIENPRRKTLIIYKDIELYFPAILQSSLKNLNLSNNLLDHVPPDICQCENIIDLDLSENKDLHELPLELGNLKECYLLRLNNLKILNIDEKIIKPGHLSAVSKSILEYLRSQLRREVVYYQMKIMVVGKEDRGKTTLTSVLQGLSNKVNVATNGVKVTEWKLTPTRNVQAKYKEKLPTLTLSVWDMGGQPDYYVTHQCFLTPNALYLAVWKITLNREGINNLKPWLLNIQARAPKSSVIIVATFTDLIPVKARKEIIETMHNEVERIYSSDNERYPHVIAIHEVSCKTKDGIPELQESIYKTCYEKLSKKKIPKSYVTLQNLIKNEAKTRSNNNQKPVLNSEEFDLLVHRIPNNDIKSPEDLSVATNFLQESGVLLHYSDLVHNSTSAYYFIEPSWLCALLAKIITVKESNVHVIGGIMNRVKARFLFKDEINCDDLLNFCMEILQKFEIALNLDSQRLLIPSKLPEDKPGILSVVDDEDDGQNSVKNVIRIYKMPYIPAGFWSRLITRLMINMKFLRKLSQSEKSFNDCCTSEHNYSGIKKFRIYPKNQVFWREGIFITYIGGSFIVQSMAHGMQCDNPEININVHSDNNDFAAMGFIADQIDSLIQEWYPGLANSCKMEDQIQRLIPCPGCKTNSLEDSNFFSLPACPFLEQFSVEKCAAYALHDDFIPCPEHPEYPVPLSLLIPDLLLSDVPKRLLLKQKDLDFSPTTENCIGKGGAGCVYKGLYERKTVAIKQFHETTNLSMDEMTSHFTVSGLTQIFTRTFKNFVELRQEVTLLSMLNHPNIVSLIGFSIRPLCCVLEMAPLGSLADILDKEWHKRDIAKQQYSSKNMRGLFLSKFLSYKIILQVVCALRHLHGLGIIYRDLKSDNVLVWSCDLNDAINVKISDYGISKLCAPDIGILGMEGTPGYLAPEVIKGFQYNEKVDVFSLGMFIYELISGYRPFYFLQHGAEINKFIKNGKRPNIKEDYVDPQFHELESMMRRCWHDSPHERPSTSQLLDELKSLAFTCFDGEYHFYDKKIENSYILVPNPKESIIWICHLDGEKRLFSIYDVEQATYRINDRLIPGPRILCMVQLTPLEIYWLMTENGKLEILKKTGENIMIHEVHDLEIDVSILIKQDLIYSIFAGCSDGRIINFKSSSENYEDLLFWDNWKIKEIRPFHDNSTVNTLLQKDDKLLANNNSCITVIHLETLEILININIEPTISKPGRFIQIDGSIWYIALKHSNYQFNIYYSENFLLKGELSTKSTSLKNQNLQDGKMTRAKSFTNLMEMNQTRIQHIEPVPRQRKTSVNALVDWYSKNKPPIVKQIEKKSETTMSDSVKPVKIIDCATPINKSNITDIKLIKDTLWIGKSCGSIDIIATSPNHKKYGQCLASLINTKEEPIYQLMPSNEGIISIHSTSNSLILKKWKSYSADEIYNICENWKLKSDLKTMENEY